MIYKIYGLFHKYIKKFLRKNNDLENLNSKMISFNEDIFNDKNTFVGYNDTSFYINEKKYESGFFEIKKNDVYPIENLISENFQHVKNLSFIRKKSKIKKATTLEEASKSWLYFIENSKIPSGYRNEGLHYGGFIYEYQEWCLPSWVWTNAAIVRYYCSNNDIDNAQKLGDKIISYQKSSGAWIVRNDYTKEGAIPLLAGNDSSYIALNCCMKLYEITKISKYLKSAEKCANWIIETSKDDGLVFFGYDVKNNIWIKDKNIVDIGFTAGLFSRLYSETKNKKYLDFLTKFIKAYINNFYNEKNKCFSTAIDKNGNQVGGAFARGQAWALEGLIPVYKILQDQEIKLIIENTINTLLKYQLNDGGWSYNLFRPLMGVDGKATPVISKIIMEWYLISKEDIRLLNSSKKALKWCVKNTSIEGKSRGGIFSYTTEGAIVHNLYTKTALVYSSAYALETKKLIEKGEFQ